MDGVDTVTDLWRDPTRCTNPPIKTVKSVAATRSSDPAPIESPDSIRSMAHKTGKGMAGLYEEWWCMSKMATTLIVVLCGSIGACHISGVLQTDDCPAGLQETLERGGFSGVVFCGKPNAEAEFALAGVAAMSDAKYTVYDYRYRFLPENENVWHGGQRMIIIRNNEYLGQFVLSPPPDTTITLNGTKLTLSKPNVETAIVDLAKEIPKELFFDGEVMDLAR